MAMSPLFLGVDVGTSGVRAIAIDEAGDVQAQAARPMPAPERTAEGGIVQDPAIWREAAFAVLGERTVAGRARAGHRHRRHLGHASSHRRRRTAARAGADVQ